MECRLAPASKTREPSKQITKGEILKKLHLAISLTVLAALLAPVFAEEILLDTSDIPAKSEITPENTETEKEILPAVILEPKWDEFCEAGYENSKINNKKNVLDIFSFVQAEKEKQNYWAERKAAFDKQIQYCKTKSGQERDNCYIDVRAMEKDKNDMYERERKRLIYQHNVIINTPQK